MAKVNGVEEGKLIKGLIFSKAASDRYLRIPQLINNLERANEYEVKVERGEGQNDALIKYLKSSDDKSDKVSGALEKVLNVVNDMKGDIDDLKLKVHK